MRGDSSICNTQATSQGSSEDSFQGPSQGISMTNLQGSSEQFWQALLIESSQGHSQGVSKIISDHNFYNNHDNDLSEIEVEEEAIDIPVKVSEAVEKVR